MNIPEIKTVQLTPDEAALREQMETEFSNGRPYSGEAACQLMKSLGARNAIPVIRLRTFTEPFPGGRGKSHQDVFVRNGCRGDAIFKSPFFVRYLQYFIDGPALPVSTLEGFRRILIEDSGTSGQIMDQLCRFARAEVRRLRLERSEAREQFWRLAQEVEYFHANTIRDAAASAAKR